MPTMPDGYYNRFNTAQSYDAHLFRAGYVLQSAELNEIQSHLAYRLQRVADVLFQDGAVIRDAQLIVDPNTGAAIAEAGAIYLKGAVRGIPRREFTLATTGAVSVGAYLVETVITEVDDPTLRDPALGVRNYQEPGASRLQAAPQWGVAGDPDAPANSTFYPVYTVVDGVMQSKEPPPQLDAVSTALARYDRESSGGYYIVEGLKVLQRIQIGGDLPDGDQVYTVSQGRARVNGQAVYLATSVRNVYPATADLRLVDSEPHVSDTADPQRINTDFAPIAQVTQVRIVMEKTVTLTHGAYSGALDPLPDSAVLEILTVAQGATTYDPDVDYQRTGNQVDWSLPGDEPAPGSTYTATYRYITSVTPTLVDETGMTVTGAVVGTLIQISYRWKLPRWDRLCLKADGQLVWVAGTPHEWTPALPRVPEGLLLLASVYQDWREPRLLRADGPRMVPMGELEAMNQRIDSVYALIAEQRLLTDAANSESVSKQGVFVDPFLDDDLRDQGLEQTGAIFNGELTLGLMPNVTTARISGGVQTLPLGSPTPLIEQTLRTGFMKVNPYQAFAPLPASVQLTPNADFWTVNLTQWLSEITLRFGSGNVVDRTTTVQTVSRTTTLLEFLRPIEVQFVVRGFDPNEALQSLTFDGIAVTATA